MATLTHNLNTIELGSTNWRNIINFNFEQLDKNRFFVVELDSNLPTTGFKNERFFFSKESKKTYFDNGTQLLEIAGGSSGTEIDLANNPNKYLKVNATGTALEYVTISSSAGLENNSNGALSISILSTNDSNFSNSLGYNNLISNSNMSNIFGYNNTLTSNGTGRNHAFGIENKNFNSNSNYNIFIGTANYNYSGSRSIKIGDNLSNSSADENINIGSSFSANKESTINISPFGLDVLNSYSINTRVGTVQNSRLHMRKSSLNTSTLTDVYFKGTESINLMDYSVANIEFKVTMLNESNYTDTCVINGEVIVVQTGSGVIVKHIDKKTVYKDSIFNGADIDFVAGYPRNVLFQVNTNGVTCKMVAKFDITYC